ncbi:uncharacterized protein LOC135922837 isoform X2 [Gordionus sp. m RMFG-2023]
MDLSNNEIHAISRKMFSGLPKLQRLNFAGNNFQTILKGTFDALPSLKWINLPNNNLICDCKLKWIVSWISRNRIKIPTNIVCGNYPKALKGKRIKKLKRKELHCNWPPEFSLFTIYPSTPQLLFSGDALNLTCTLVDDIFEQTGPSINKLKLEWFIDGLTVPYSLSQVAWNYIINNDTNWIYKPDKILESKYNSKRPNHIFENNTNSLNSGNNIHFSRIIVVSNLYISSVSETYHTGTYSCKATRLDEKDTTKDKFGNGKELISTSLNLRIDVVSTGESNYCLTEVTKNAKGIFVWPKILRGGSVAVDCPHGSAGSNLTNDKFGQAHGNDNANFMGKAIRHCNLNSSWEEPNSLSCFYSDPTTRELLTLSKSDMSNPFRRSDNLKRIYHLVFKNKYGQTNTSEIIQQIDLIYIVDTLEKIVPYIISSRSEKSAQFVVQIISSIMDLPANLLSSALTRNNSSSKIMKLMDEIISLLSAQETFIYTPNVIFQNFIVKPSFFYGMTCVAYQTPNSINTDFRKDHKNFTDLDEIYENLANESFKPTLQYPYSSHSSANKYSPSINHHISKILNSYSGPNSFSCYADQASTANIYENSYDDYRYKQSFSPHLSGILTERMFMEISSESKNDYREYIQAMIRIPKESINPGSKKSSNINVVHNLESFKSNSSISAFSHNIFIQDKTTNLNNIETTFSDELLSTITIVIYKKSNIFVYNDDFNKSIYNYGRVYNLNNIKMGPSIRPAITTPVIIIKIGNKENLNGYSNVSYNPFTVVFKCLGASLYDQPVYWDTSSTNYQKEKPLDGCTIVKYIDKFCILQCNVVKNLALLQDSTLSMYQKHSRFNNGYNDVRGVIKSLEGSNIVKSIMSYRKYSYYVYNNNFQNQLLPWYMYIGGCLLFICLVVLSVIYITFQGTIIINNALRHSLINYWIGCSLLLFIYLFGIRFFISKDDAMILIPLACKLVGLILHYTALSVLFWLTLISKTIHDGIMYKYKIEMAKLKTSSVKSHNNSSYSTSLVQSGTCVYDLIQLNRGLNLPEDFDRNKVLRKDETDNPNCSRSFFNSKIVPNHYLQHRSLGQPNIEDYDKFGHLDAHAPNNVYQTNNTSFSSNAKLIFSTDYNNRLTKKLPLSPSYPVLSHYFVGYGVSIIICGITAAISMENYYSIDNGYCFLVWDVALWSFYLPASILILANCIFLTKCTYIFHYHFNNTICHHNYQCDNDKSNSNNRGFDLSPLSQCHNRHIEELSFNLSPTGFEEDSCSKRDMTNFKYDKCCREQGYPNFKPQNYQNFICDTYHDTHSETLSLLPSDSLDLCPKFIKIDIEEGINQQHPLFKTNNYDKQNKHNRCRTTAVSNLKNSFESIPNHSKLKSSPTICEYRYSQNKNIKISKRRARRNNRKRQYHHQFSYDNFCFAKQCVPIGNHKLCDKMDKDVIWLTKNLKTRNLLHNLAHKQRDNPKEWNYQSQSINHRVRKQLIPPSDYHTPIRCDKNNTLSDLSTNILNNPSYVLNLTNDNENQIENVITRSAKFVVDGQKSIPNLIKFHLLTMLALFILWHMAGLSIKKDVQVSPIFDVKDMDIDRVKLGSLTKQQKAQDDYQPSFYYFMDDENDNMFNRFDQKAHMSNLHFYGGNKIGSSTENIKRIYVRSDFAKFLFSNKGWPLQAELTGESKLDPNHLRYYLDYFASYFRNSNSLNPHVVDNNIYTHNSFTQMNKRRRLRLRGGLPSYAFTTISIMLGLTLFFYHGLSRDDIVKPFRNILWLKNFVGQRMAHVDDLSKKRYCQFVLPYDNRLNGVRTSQHGEANNMKIKNSEIESLSIVRDKILNTSQSAFNSNMVLRQHYSWVPATNNRKKKIIRGIGKYSRSTNIPIIMMNVLNHHYGDQIASRHDISYAKASTSNEQEGNHFWSSRWYRSKPASN